MGNSPIGDSNPPRKNGAPSRALNPKRSSYSISYAFGGGLAILFLAVVVFQIQGLRREIARYRIIDLGSVKGSNTTIFSFTNAGELVGEASPPGGTKRAFYWSSEHGLLDLGTFGGPTSSARSINGSGAVVGFAHDDENHDRAFAWSREGGLSEMGTLGGKRSRALGTTWKGSIWGEAELAGVGQQIHAFKKDPGGGLVDLGTLGGTRSCAHCMNDRGEVVGFSFTQGAQAPRAFRWSEKDGMVDLGTLGGADSVAFCINASGLISGKAETDSKTEHAALWDPDGRIHDLGTLGGPRSCANSVNNHGDVVGYSEPGLGNKSWMAEKVRLMMGDLLGQKFVDHTTHGFLWEKGEMTDLNDLVPSGSGWVIHEAWGMDDDGKVLGVGSRDGKVRSVLLVPQDSEDLDLWLTVEREIGN